MLFKTLTFNEFLSLAQNQNVICFGSGIGLRNFVYRMKANHLENQVITTIVDNDPFWHDKTLKIFDRTYTVKPVSWLKDNIKNSIVCVMVYNREKVADIRQQLNGYSELSNTIVCGQNDFFFMNPLYQRAEKYILPDNIHVSEQPLIPKVIHYCWFGKNPIPEQYKIWMNSWKKFCPDYKIIRWDESNYDINKHKYVKAAYEAGKWAFVSDFARLDIVYEHGGIYLDTDVELIKSLDDFLYQDGFAGYSVGELLNTGYGFGARARLPIIKKLLNEYDNERFCDFSDKREQICVRVCPEIQTGYLYRNGYTYTNKILNVEGLRIYPAPVLCGEEKLRTKYTYAVHHYAGSWDFFKK